MGQKLAEGQSVRPLCVDLDGTLISSDLLFEATVRLLAANPLMIFMLPIWFLAGKSVLKDELAQRVSLDPATLPYRKEVVEFLEEQHRSGRELILASASHHHQVKAVADHLQFFSDSMGTTREHNLKSSVKAQALVDRFGSKGFDYMGDSLADLAVWKEAASALVVAPGESLRRQAEKITPVSKHFSVRSTLISKALVKALRPHQWVKNILLFVPAIMAQQITDVTVIFAVLKAFLAFSMCASAVYIMNDLADLDSDRIHKKKRKRPFASGDLSLLNGFWLFPALLALAALTASTLPAAFHGILVVYMITTTFYSFYLKQKAIVDILTLASLYTVRIFAGGCATTIVVSPWLLAFSIFIFFSLASVKRYSELWSLKEARKTTTPGRGYSATDLELIGQAGITSGFLAVLVMALYINSPEMVKFYSHGQYLWGMCLPMLYWISRVWLLAYRGQMNEDPILFALKDFPSYVVGLLFFILLVIAM